MITPAIDLINGISVVRDDALPGGTNYDAKAWQFIKPVKNKTVLFWNVAR